MRIQWRVMALACLGVCAAGFAVAHPGPASDPVATAPVLEAQYAPPAEAVEQHVLGRGETLSDVLNRASLGGPDMSGLVLALREQVDPRRLLPNTSVLVRRWAESGSPRAVEVTLNADSIVLLRRNDVGWTGEMRLTPTVVDTVYLSGRLGGGASSIYRAVLDHPELDLPRKEREALVWQLAHIYGWILDFSHDLHPDDSFRVAYEREARPDGTSRAARVLIAEIVNRGTPLQAILFDAHGSADYYNPEGKSLRLQFRRYPVAYPRITSNFNWRRYHPILKRSRPHLGTDFGTGYGAPILATADGVISFAAWDGGYGNLVKIEHGNGYETRYAHLSRFAKGVRRGARVKQGQTIGYSGATGLATAPHLHYEFRRYGQAVDPRGIRLPAAPPVPTDRMAEFRTLAESRSILLSGGGGAPDEGSGEPVLPAD